MSAAQRTPLFDFHVRHGARMVNFAGWEMPVHYGSILEEHKAVRRASGLFDVSHMGEVEVRGPQALEFLEHLVTNEVTKLYPGRVLYSPMCNEAGGTVDDLLVHMRTPQNFFLCINAGNIASDLAWIARQAVGFEVAVTDRSADYALLAVQGPRSAAIVQTLTHAKLGGLGYYHFCEGIVAGAPCLISRTGYTGEDGFELYHAPADGPALAEALLVAGQPHGLALAGLGARDSLRLEAGYPLYGHELAADLSPLTAGLGWTVKLGKARACVGRAALAREKAEGGSHRVVFFRTGDRRIVRADAQVTGAGGGVVGRVLSGTLSPVLNEAIGSALIASAAVRGPLAVDIRGTNIPLQIVTPPFVPLRQG
ncbi:MAG: glycine cleavage system aminomethyltransferase GcvT [Verrucomicrobia bacterium]|nr:MAG: glycine cleavage system aminomethyltransferase GcvT [Verrucomicrobiota bacterium]